ncbi:MAG TPA: hypothetical protein ENI61_05390, partial [Ignavibacteria bacterium]|nr:hypothetical protein [Ignavibacteria bacterium]
MGTFSRDFNVKVNTILGVEGLEKFGKLIKAEETFEKQMYKSKRAIEKRKNKQKSYDVALGKRSAFYKKWTSELGLSQMELDKVMKQAGKKLKENGDITDLAGVKQQKYGNDLRDSSFAANRFQMENLGVMFAGMALQRVMSKLNSTSREWVGMNELMSTAMGVVTLPTTMALLNEGIIPLFNVLTNLPESAKLAIGTLTTALEVLGGLMFTGGQLMLGLNSTAMVLSKISGISPKIILTSKGFGLLYKKYGKAFKMMGKLVRLAAAGIALKFAYDDLKAGKSVAAMGDALVAAGLIKGGVAGKYIAVAGILLKIVGDKNFLTSLIKIGLKIEDFFANLVEGIGEMFKKLWESIFNNKDLNLGNINFIKNYKEANLNAVNEINKEGGFKSNLFKNIDQKNYQYPDNQLS